jgi:hypothetical protein
MINKDYIMRIVERLGRALARILYMRQANQNEEALIYIDDLFMRTLGIGSGFINSVSDEMLLAMISPLGAFNIEKCLFIAALLKVEADIYADWDNSNESYHRYLKSLHLFLEAALREGNLTLADPDVTVSSEIDDIVKKLDAYELPLKTKSKLFQYYEKMGKYSQAEDALFEMIEAEDAGKDIVEQGIAFYTRLQQKSDAELLAGNLPREEVAEGLAHLKAR